MRGDPDQQPDAGPFEVFGPYAQRLSDYGDEAKISPSTLRAAIAQGRGPRTFTIGRLIYCRRIDWLAWLDTLAETGGTGPLSPPSSGVSEQVLP